MNKNRRKYDKEFKQQAVNLYFSSDQSFVEVAEDLGIPQSTLANWCKKTKEHPDDPFPGRGKLRPEDAKQKEILKENGRLRRERDILKKSFGHFLKSTEDKFKFIDQQRSEFSVKEIARVLEVSRSGYYKWRNRSPSKREIYKNSYKNK